MSHRSSSRATSTMSTTASTASLHMIARSSESKHTNLLRAKLAVTVGGQGAPKESGDEATDEVAVA